MLRVGKGKTGIVMSGKIVSEPYRDKDWSGKGRAIHYVNIQPDFLVDTERGAHLGIRDLEKAFPHYVWNEGLSGMVLNDSLGTKLEWLWVEFLYGAFARRRQEKFRLQFVRFGRWERCQKISLRHGGVACEICGYDYGKIFNLVPLDSCGVQNIYCFFPGKRLGKSVRKNFTAFAPTAGTYTTTCAPIPMAANFSLSKVWRN